MYQEWSVTWQGQPIVVRTWVNWLWAKAELRVGGIIVDRSKSYGLFRSADYASECLAAPISLIGNLYNIEVLIIQGSFKCYCNILVNGEVVGGDLVVNLKIRDTNVWEKIRKRGMLLFLLKCSCLFGLEICLVAALLGGYLFYKFQYTSNLTMAIAKWSAAGLLSGLLGGLVVGLTMWWSSESIYSASLAHRSKLAAPPLYKI
jgi:hypothetical protein